MSWDRTCGMSTATSSTGSGSSSNFSPTSLTREYDLPPPPLPPPPPTSSLFLFSTSDYADEQSNREREEPNLFLPPPPSAPVFPNYHHFYSPIFPSRNPVSDACLCNSTSSQLASYDNISSTFQSSFVYEQYLTSLKSEQSEHLPYLFDNIIYPQPCSPPSPTNDSITYYQLDQANTTTIINKFPQRAHIQPIIYQQLSLIEPPSSNIQQKIPMIKRFYYDSNMSNTTTTTIIATTPLVSSTTNDQAHLPYARLDSNFFGTYEVWQEKTLVGRKNNRREVDVNMGFTSVVSRIHFELLLINGMEFHLKCLSKNGLFINNNYTKMSSTTILSKQCTLRFPSTDICISFTSLLNSNHSLHRTSTESLSHHLSTDESQRRRSSSSIPMEMGSMISFQSVVNLPPPQQQVIFLGVNPQSQSNLDQKTTVPLSINIPNSSLSSSSSIGSSLSTGSCHEQMKCSQESPTTTTTTMNHPFLGSSSSINLKTEPNEIQPIVNSPNIGRMIVNGNDHLPIESDNHYGKNGTKPPFSYAQLIVQAIVSAPDKQMTLSQIYNFISAQYPYYEANNRGWQNSIRHNLSLNRYFIRLARKENESGKGSFWRLDQTSEEKLIDHAFRHRKQRGNSSSNTSIIKNQSEEVPSPTTTQYCNDPTDFLLADVPSSNSSTSSSPMISPIQSNEVRHKRKFHDEIEDLLHFLIDSIQPDMQLTTDQRSKRPKI